MIGLIIYLIGVFAAIIAHLVRCYRRGEIIIRDILSSIPTGLFSWIMFFIILSEEFGDIVVIKNKKK